MNTPDNLTTLATELEEARQDLALAKRLESAPERVERLTRDYEAAKATHQAEEAARAAAEYEAQFAGIRDLRVTVTGDTGPDAGGPLWASYEITFVRPSWESWSNRTVQKTYTHKGFHSLPPEVFRYLLDKVPEQIPPAIAALAPGDPYAAFDRYFSGRKRGYL